jgi:internalin A
MRRFLAYVLAILCIALSTIMGVRRLPGQAVSQGASEFKISDYTLTSLPAEVQRLPIARRFDFEKDLGALLLILNILYEPTSLDLSVILLSDLPPEIGQLSTLQTLDLSTNQLSSLPPEITQLKELRELNLDYNGLTSLPPIVGQLSTLEVLNLNGNQLTEGRTTLNGR